MKEKEDLILEHEASWQILYFIKIPQYNWENAPIIQDSGDFHGREGFPSIKRGFLNPPLLQNGVSPNTVPDEKQSLPPPDNMCRYSGL